MRDVVSPAAPSQDAVGTAAASAAAVGTAGASAAAVGTAGASAPTVSAAGASAAAVGTAGASVPTVGTAEGAGGRCDGSGLGELAGAPLTTVVTALSRRRLTGLLHVGELGELWFDRGAIYLANGPSSPSLFDVLVAAEITTGRQLEALCSQADTGGRDVVDGLATADAAGRDRLRRLLHEHVAGALFELVVSTGAEVTLEVGARHVLGSRYAEPADDLLAEVELRLELWRQVARRIPTTAARFRLARSLPDGSERLVSADEWAFLALLDGRRTVAEVITATGDSAFRVCAVLYRMLLEEVIEPAEA